MLDKLFRKKKPEATEAMPPDPGFFSTSIRLPRAPKAADMQQYLNRSFQRKAGEFRPVTPDGTAMDEGLSSIKPTGELGGFLPYNQIGWYASQGFIGYQMCAMIAQHWLVNKVCTMPARDAMRNGYEITFNDGKEVDAKIADDLKKRDKKMQVKKKSVEFLRKGRIFGIMFAMPRIVYTDPDALSKPFNINGIAPHSYRGMVLIEPYWITPELDQEAACDPTSGHFYEPTWWRVNGKRVHRSHLVIFKNGELPDVLKPTYYYGGIPVPQMIAERVYAAERTANEAPALSLSKRTTVIHADLEAALANQGDFEARMNYWAQLRDNYGIKVLGREETAEQFDTSLADFDATIMTQYQLVAAIGGVPATKLLGTSPKGFNATGEFEMKSYHEELESIQENDIQPFIEMHHECLIASEFPQLAGRNPMLAWEPVAPLSAKEQAEVNKIKADTGSALSAVGAIDGEDERRRIISEKDSGYTGISAEMPDPPDFETNALSDLGGEDDADKSISA